MEKNYYEVLIAEITDNLQQSKLTEAKILLEAELAMPYIPLDIENKLLQLQDELRLLQALPIKQQYFSEEELEMKLEGSNEEQLTAIEYLSQRNLRDYLELIRKFFKDSKQRIIENVLIDALIRQGLQEEFSLLRDGIEYSFIPALLELPGETAAFQQAYQLLLDWFESDNPSLLMMATELLLYQLYWVLPEAYEEDEAELLAASISVVLLEQLGDEQQKQEFLNSHNINEEKLFTVIMPV